MKHWNMQLKKQLNNTSYYTAGNWLVHYRILYTVVIKSKHPYTSNVISNVIAQDTIFIEILIYKHAYHPRRAVKILL